MSWGIETYKESFIEGGEQITATGKEPVL